jgi:hypothetical protein
VKVQYFGDVNDYRKYALLRMLAKSGGFKIGVCWMLTPADERRDGGKRSYAEHPAQWRAFDPDLFDLLAAVKAKPELTDLLRIESEGLIPGAIFVNEIVPDSRSERTAFHQSGLSAFNGCDLAFFDPDNGLEGRSLRKGRKSSSKFVFRDEISDHCAAGRSVLFYQHYPHEPRQTFLSKIAGKVSEALPDATIWFFQTAHAVFVLITRPEHAQRAKAVAAEISEKWPANFIKPQPHLAAEIEATNLL